MTSSTSPLFSIIIPSYNYAEYLPDTVQSVFEQSETDFELIILNDGSTDSTEEVMAKLCEKYPQQLRCYSHPNRGLSGTRNRGVELAKGEYFLFLDSDDKLTRNALKTFKQYISIKPDADFLIGRYYSVSQSGNKKPRCLWSLSDSREINFRKYITDDSVSMLCSSVIFRKNIFTRFTFPDHIPQSEDEALFAHIFANFNAVKVEEFTAEILKHDGSLRGKYDPDLHDLPERLTKELFDPTKIPEEYMKYKNTYLTLKYLDQFRTLYINKKYDLAIGEYKKAFSLQKKLAFKANFLRKAIKAYFKK